MKEGEVMTSKCWDAEQRRDREVAEHNLNNYKGASGKFFLSNLH